MFGKVFGGMFERVWGKVWGGMFGKAVREVLGEMFGRLTGKVLGGVVREMFRRGGLGGGGGGGRRRRPNRGRWCWERRTWNAVRGSLRCEAGLHHKRGMIWESSSARGACWRPRGDLRTHLGWESSKATSPFAP